jgi:hypothetical protein
MKAPLDAILTPEEAKESNRIAWLRHQPGLVQQHGVECQLFWMDENGTAGEAACCKALGIPWSKSVNTFKNEPDAGNNIEIRTTHHLRGCLIVRPDDKPYRYFCHVTGRNTNFRLWGWIPGHEARLDKYVQAPNGRPPAWFVPIEALNNDLTELLRLDAEWSAP